MKSMKHTKAEDTQIDWLDEDGQIIADKYLDKVVALLEPKLGSSQSGRSDEYAGFGKDENMAGGFVEWYLYLRDDDLDGKTPEESDMMVNVDIIIGLDTPNGITPEWADTLSDLYMNDLAGDRKVDVVMYDDKESRPNDFSKVKQVVLDFYGLGGHVETDTPELAAKQLGEDTLTIVDYAKDIQKQLAEEVKAFGKKSIAKSNVKPVQVYIGASAKRIKLLN